MESHAHPVGTFPGAELLLRVALFPATHHGFQTAHCPPISVHLKGLEPGCAGGPLGWNVTPRPTPHNRQLGPIKDLGDSWATATNLRLSACSDRVWALCLAAALTTKQRGLRVGQQVAVGGGWATSKRLSFRTSLEGQNPHGDGERLGMTWQNEGGV